MKIKLSLVTLIICALILGGGCSEWRGDEGIVNVRITGADAGSGGGRSIISGTNPSSNLTSYTYDVYFIKSATPVMGKSSTTVPSIDHYDFYRKDIVGSIGNIKYGSTASISLVPGTWILVVSGCEIGNKDAGIKIQGVQPNCIIKPGVNEDILITMKETGTGGYYKVD